MSFTITVTKILLFQPSYQQKPKKQLSIVRIEITLTNNNGFGDDVRACAAAVACPPSRDCCWCSAECVEQVAIVGSVYKLSSFLINIPLKKE